MSCHVCVCVWNPCYTIEVVRCNSIFLSDYFYSYHIDRTRTRTYSTSQKIEFKCLLCRNEGTLVVLKSDKQTNKEIVKNEKNRNDSRLRFNHKNVRKKSDVCLRWTVFTFLF